MRNIKTLHSLIVIEIYKRFRSFPVKSARLSDMASENCNKTFKNLKFDNVALRVLPVDSETQNYRRQVKGACFSLVQPEPVSNPKLMAFSRSVFKLLDIPAEEVEKDENVGYLSGNELMTGSVTASHCYCGHQFGVFAGQLGDGAAIYLGEVVNNAGERWEIQLKGAGPTPYSRSADGRKVIRSSIREFLCSEAMHHLGIPTTRAASVITSDNKVIRDIFYTGNAISENCAVVMRVAPTFFRFGSFEIFKPTDQLSGREGPSVGQNQLLKKMLDYCAEYFYPDIWTKYNKDKTKIYLEMYREIVKRTAHLVVEWQCAGWVHGVLNTDNLSIVGLTIDYGPFGFIDAYNPGFVSNTSDDNHRYSYKEQPKVCRWNCEKLAEAWSDVVPLKETQKILESVYDKEFSSAYHDKMHKKLGLFTHQKNDSDLIENLLSTMSKTGSDFTNTFRCLSRLPLPDSVNFEENYQKLETYILSQCRTVDEMKLDNKSNVDSKQFQLLLMLAKQEPSMIQFIPGGAQLLKDELDKIELAKDVETMTEDDKRHKDREMWARWLQQYLDRLKLENLSDPEFFNKRTEIMNKNNPRVVLRNYLAQNAIVAAERGQFTELRKLLRVLEDPFSDLVDLSEFDVTSDPVEEAAPSCRWKSYHRIDDYTSKPPSWSRGIRVSCSS